GRDVDDLVKEGIRSLRRQIRPQRAHDSFGAPPLADEQDSKVRSALSAPALSSRFPLLAVCGAKSPALASEPRKNLPVLPAEHTAIADGGRLAANAPQFLRDSRRQIFVHHDPERHRMP